MTTLWFVVDKKTRKLISLSEYDGRGKQFYVAGWRTKGELIQYFKSYGSVLKKGTDNILYGDGNQEWEICHIDIR